MHFGLYLKKKGTITAEQLVAALEEQMSLRVPIGQLALEEGLLAARDIFEILQAQKDSPHERFGDLAVEMGLMTRDEVVRLLMIQADRKRPIAMILKSQGVLSEQELANELAAYRQSLLQPQRKTKTFVVPATREKTNGRTPANAVATV
jgi:hypothetical protein